MEYPLDEKETQRLLKSWPNHKAELVWMAPEKFLENVPLPGLATLAATFGLNRPEFWSTVSITDLIQKIISKRELDPLYLDYTNMFRGWPSHEGRHRAIAAIRLGIEKVPVIVVN